MDIAFCDICMTRSLYTTKDKHRLPNQHKFLWIKTCNVFRELTNWLPYIHVQILPMLGPIIELHPPQTTSKQNPRKQQEGKPDLKTHSEFLQWRKEWERSLTLANLVKLNNMICSFSIQGRDLECEKVC